MLFGAEVAAVRATSTFSILYVEKGSFWWATYARISSTLIEWSIGGTVLDGWVNLNLFTHHLDYLAKVPVEIQVGCFWVGHEVLLWSLTELRESVKDKTFGAALTHRCDHVEVLWQLAWDTRFRAIAVVGCSGGAGFVVRVVGWNPVGKVLSIHQIAVEIISEESFHKTHLIISRELHTRRADLTSHNMKIPIGRQGTTDTLKPVKVGILCGTFLHFLIQGTNDTRLSDIVFIFVKVAFVNESQVFWLYALFFYQTEH